MAAPPLEAGAVQLTLAEALPAVAVTAVGAPGTVAGVTLFDASDAALVPTALVAVTVKLYAVPFVRPVTVAVVGTTVLPSGALTVTVIGAATPTVLEVTV